MTRIRTVLLVCALALSIPAAIAGCGGGDSSDADPETVLDDTFDNDTKVTSGDLSLSASVSAEGDQGGQFEVSLGGPFQGSPDEPESIPQLDWTGSLSGEGAGQSIDFSGGLVVTEDNAYVEYQDQAYEVGPRIFGRVQDQIEAQAGAAPEAEDLGSFEEQCATALQQAGATDTSACEIDLESWLENLTNEGTEDVGGTETTHIAGDANVDQILTDIGNLVAAIPNASTSGFDPSQLGAASGAVTDASIDVYSGTEDSVLRKLDANLTIDPSAIAGGELVPVSNIQIAFSVEIDGLNEEQTIEAPTGAKPISELFGNLGVSPGALDGALGGSSGLGGGESGDTGAYLDCLQQANTPEAINDCASQL